MPKSNRPGYDRGTASFLSGVTRGDVTNDPDKTDQELFRASVRGVKRLQHQQVTPHRARVPPRPHKTPRMQAAEETPLRAAPVAGEFDACGTEPAEELAFARPGLQHGVLRKLRRGRFAIGADLDLHGMTVPLARRALQAFLADCLLADERCVRVIHGKGLRAPSRASVLKSRVDAWLRQDAGVLAFCSARAQDGGTGAVYVLLKTRR